MSNQPSQHKKGAIDKAVFWPATILTLAMAVFFLMNQHQVRLSWVSCMRSPRESSAGSSY